MELLLIIYIPRSIRLDFNLEFRLFIGLHHLGVYHRWKERINLYNI